MRKIGLTVIAGALLLCVGTAQAQCVQQCANAPAQRFVDNGDGTITDTCTNLMWEKKTTEAGRHDVNNTYLWSADTTFKPDGSIFTKFLYGLNDVLLRCDANGSNCTQVSLAFAGHSDWRLPEFDELVGISDNSFCTAGGRFTGVPCIDPIFGHTHAKPYWSATTVANARTVAANIDFFSASLVGGDKALDHDYVRAVRCGK